MFAPRLKSLILLGLAAALTACTVTVTPQPVETLPPTPLPPEPNTVTPSTAPRPTTEPTIAPTRRPTATRPPIDDPTVPGFGSPNDLTGRITLPGYTGALDVPVFEDAIAFQLAVFDPAAGEADGAGITSVDFTISDPSGTRRYASTIDRPPYCAFAGDPSCEVYVFAEHDNAWPDGTPICAGSGYQAGMIVHTTHPERDGAFWGFNFSVAGNYPPCS